jgi:hypothetical protein
MTNEKNNFLPVKKADISSEVDIKHLLLHEGMSISEEVSSVYNLQEEFSSSKANKSHPVYIAIIAFTLLLLGTTIWFTYGIQRDIDRISVGISEFADLNLAELLGALKKAESDLKNVDDKIALTRQAMELELEKVRHDSSMEIKKIEKSGLGQAEKNRLIKAMQDELDRKLRANKKKYEDRLKEKQREAEEARIRMEALKNKLAAEKADFEKTMNLRTKSYKKEADNQVLMTVMAGSEQKEKSEKQLEDQKRNYKEILDKYEKELKVSRDETSRESEKSRDTERLLEHYKRALLYYAKTRGEHGYVIDPGTDGNMLLDVNPYIVIKKGDQAYVLNQDSNILALVELQPAGIRMKAKVLKRMLPGEIHPFDKILLKKN